MSLKGIVAKIGFTATIIFFNLQLNAQAPSPQQDFIIKGVGNGMSDNDIIYLVYKENGKLNVDSTKVKNHKFNFAGKIGNSPIMASLTRNQNPTHDLKFVYDSKTIYLESGKILLRSNDTLSNSILSGTDLNRTLQLKDERLVKIVNKLKSVKDPYIFNEEELKDTNMVKQNQRLIDSLFLKWKDQELDFAKDYPDSYVSLDVVNKISKITSLIDKTEKVFNGFSTKIKAMPEADIVRNNIREKQKIQIGNLAPLFEMKNLNGNIVNLASYKGRFVLIDFWASWCLPCRDEHPNLIEIDKLYGDRNFSILSISIDSKEDDWKRAVEADNLTWTQLSDLKASYGEVYREYGITTIPSNFLIDPNGKVIAKDLKGDTLKNILRDILQ